MITDENYNEFLTRSDRSEQGRSDIKPMKYDDIRMFKVDNSKTKCKLKPGEYFIKKQMHYLRPGKTMFFASKDKAFDVNPNNEKHDLKKYYKNQLGFSSCSKGWIGLVEVNGPETDIDARQCGIGTVLVSLCMNDPELNMLAAAKVEWEFKDDFHTVKAIIKGCRKFLGLMNQADPPSGARMNFKAAKTTGFNKFLIKNEKEKYVWMDTERAEKCYNDLTGEIGKEISGLVNDWWFCEEIPGKFPKFPNLNPCGDKPKH